MTRINIPDNEIWSYDGDNTKPDIDRFMTGNTQGEGVKPPAASEHNYQMNRSDNNMQYVLKNAKLPWDENESYPVGATVYFGDKEYRAIQANSNKNPSTEPDYWEWIDNKHLPAATTTEKGISRFATNDEAINAVIDLIATNPSAVLALLKSRISDSYAGKRSDYAVSEKAIDSALFAQTPLTAKNLIKEDLNDFNSKEHAGFYHQSTNSNTVGNNYPVELAGALMVQMTVLGSVNSVVQTYFEWSKARQFTRAFVSGTWTNWAEVYSQTSPQNFVEVSGTVKDTFLGKTEMSYTDIVSPLFYSDAPTGRVAFVKPGSLGMPETSINGYMIKIGARDTLGGSSWLLVTDSSSATSKFYYGVADTMESAPQWIPLYSPNNPPKVDEISGLEHIGKTAVGVSVMGVDFESESYQEYYDYGGDDFNLVSFDPSTYETQIYYDGYYLVDVITMRGAIVGTPVSGINVTVKVNNVEYMHGFVATDDATKRNPIQMKRVIKLLAGDKVRVYSDQDANWIDGGSITFQYSRPLEATKKTKDK